MKFSKLHSDLKIIEFKFLHLKTIVYYCIKNCPIFSSSTSLESPQAPLHFGMRVFTVVQIVEKLWANVQDMLSTPVTLGTLPQTPRPSGYIRIQSYL